MVKNFYNGTKFSKHSCWSYGSISEDFLSSERQYHTRISDLDKKSSYCKFDMFTKWHVVSDVLENLKVAVNSTTILHTWPIYLLLRGLPLILFVIGLL